MDMQSLSWYDSTLLEVTWTKRQFSVLVTLVFSNQVEAMVEDSYPRIVRSYQEFSISIVVAVQAIDASDNVAVHGGDVGVAALYFVDDSVFSLVDGEDIAHPMVVANDQSLAVV